MTCLQVGTSGQQHLLIAVFLAAGFQSKLAIFDLNLEDPDFELDLVCTRHNLPVREGVGVWIALPISRAMDGGQPQLQSLCLSATHVWTLYQEEGADIVASSCLQATTRLWQHMDLEHDLALSPLNEVGYHAYACLYNRLLARLLACAAACLHGCLLMAAGRTWKGSAWTFSFDSTCFRPM